MIGARTRWIGQALLDAACWPVALLLAAIARYNFTVEVNVRAVLGIALLIAFLQVVSGLLIGLYHGRYVYGSFDEVLGVSVAAGITTAISLAVLWFPAHRAVPLSAVLVGGGGALLMMLAIRYLLRAVKQRPRQSPADAEPVIVLGVGEAGDQLVKSITRNPDSRYRVVALLDDDPAKRRLRIAGVRVRGGRTALEQVARSTGARAVVVAITGADADLLTDISDRADRCHVQVKVVPTLAELVDARLEASDVRDVSYLELLGRRPVTTDLSDISGLLRGRRVLITGAGGSIGSELSRQVHRFAPAALGLLDRDESALHALELSIKGRALLEDDSTILADIRDLERMHEVFDRFRPDVVFHAAALKHLPMLERHPEEALKTNVHGTLNVLRAARASGVRCFVNVSTDKAADPTSVLGYSKRLTERLTAGFAHHGRNRFVSVRFGNVLGSRGSVLTAFEAQIAAGGPITVTDRNVTRYFMTVSEAVHLVLQAAAVGGDGTALVLDMGAPVRIDDVARRLIKRSGQKIDIIYTGLRDGEKLDEVLLGADELDDRPVHPLISQVEVSSLSADDLDALNHGSKGSVLVRAMELLCLTPATTVGDHDRLPSAT